MDFSAALREPEDVTSVQRLDTPNPYDLSPIRTRLARYERQIQQMLATAKAHLITDKSSYTSAVELGAGAKSLYKAIEKQRKTIVEQPNSFVKNVNGLCSVYKDKLAEIELTLKKQMSVYSARMEIARREAEKNAREAARKIQEQMDREARQKGVEAPKMAAPVMPEPKKITRSGSGAAAYTKKVWTFEIVDENQIPREYLIPAEKLIRARVQQGMRNIPGVRIFQDIQTNFRSA